MIKIFKNKKPVFLLDIDGVFNALFALKEERSLITHPYGVWQVSNRSLEFLKYIAERYECYWISTWRNESNEINKYAGIKEFKSLYEKSKEEAFEKAYKKYSNIIVIDDEFSDDRAFCITPDDTKGLTQDDIDKILSHLEE